MPKQKTSPKNKEGEKSDKKPQEIKTILPDIVMKTIEIDNLQAFCDLCNNLEIRGWHVVDYDTEYHRTGTWHVIYRIKKQ